MDPTQVLRGGYQMGKLSNFFSKIPFLSGLGGKKKSSKSNVELQFDKAINLM